MNSKEAEGTGFFVPRRPPRRGADGGGADGRRAVGAEYAAAVACDMPFVDPAFVDLVFDRARGRDAAVPRPDEWLQPTLPVRARARERALDRGDGRLVAPLSEIDWTAVGIERHAAHVREPEHQGEFDPAAARL